MLVTNNITIIVIIKGSGSYFPIDGNISIKAVIEAITDMINHPVKPNNEIVFDSPKRITINENPNARGNAEKYIIA